MILLCLCFVISVFEAKSVREDAGFWQIKGESDLRKMLESKPNMMRAQNVIVFIGDGMGIQTHTMARIFKGQNKGQQGEESVLAWEDFPWSGIIKTYNTDKQVPDSAGTATAIFSGVKTRSGMLGLDSRAAYNVCDTSILSQARVNSVADWASNVHKRVGVVSTARITHATPGAVYSHTANRDWESDSSSPGGCGDIASQLVENLKSGIINFAMGGGLKNFRTQANGGNRIKNDLINELLEAGGSFIQNSGDLDTWDGSDMMLGLFSESHMDWEVERDTTVLGQPSLTAMTRKAIKSLSSAPDGYLLIVEGGRIDHAHHMNRAKKALQETLELENAVNAALELTNQEETLIIVTADHSHAITMNGYADRGNPILGTWMDSSGGRDYYVSLNRTHPTPTPYTTISYANGPGFSFHYDNKTGFWRDLSNVDTQADDFQQLGSFHFDYETHGGEDVPLYAVGPQV